MEHLLRIGVLLLHRTSSSSFFKFFEGVSIRRFLIRRVIHDRVVFSIGLILNEGIKDLVNVFVTGLLEELSLAYVIQREAHVTTLHLMLAAVIYRSSFKI